MPTLPGLRDCSKTDPGQAGLVSRGPSPPTPGLLVCLHRRRLELARARKGQGASKRITRDDNMSKASHQVFEKPEDWDSFVQTNTGLAPPAEAETAVTGGEQLAPGEQLMQQDADEAESQGRRRTEQLLGPSAAAALGKRDKAVLPKLLQPKGQFKAAPTFQREDLWNAASGPSLQPALPQPAAQPAVAKADISRPTPSSAAASDEGQLNDDEAQDWWSQLEEEFDELELGESDDEPEEAPTTRVKGPPDFVVIRQGPDPALQPASTPQASSAAIGEASTQPSAAQPGVTSPLPAVPPVSSSSSSSQAQSSSKAQPRSAPSGPPLPAIARLARSTPVPPAQPSPTLTEQLQRERDSFAQKQTPAPVQQQQQQQSSGTQSPTQTGTVRSPPSPPAFGRQSAAQQLWPRTASTASGDAHAPAPADSSSESPIKPRSSRRADVDFEWDPLPSTQQPPTQQPRQISSDPLSTLRDSATQLQQLQRQQQALSVQPSVPQQLSTAQQQPALQQQNGPSRQQEQRKPWQFAQPEHSGSDLDFFAREGFPEVGAARELLSGLNGMGIRSPSHIQAAAFQPVLAGKKDLVIADHAGSGKTLAYLAPLAQSLMEQERLLGSRPPKSPRVLVVTPTAELSAQVLQVARALAKGIPFRSFPITGGHIFRTQRKALQQGVDLVVGTPGRLCEHLQAGTLDLSACHTAVLDEADVLLGDAAAFAEQVEPLKRALPATARLLLVTATMPEPIWLQVQAKFPEVQTCLGPRLHRSAPGTAERVIDCSGGDDINEDTGFVRKADRLVQLMQEQQHPRTIIFCNKIETCRKVENHLKRHTQLQQPASSAEDLTVLPYHAAIDAKLRPANLQAFMTPPGTAPMALVCTDRASRGIDSAACNHVVLFDLPRDPSEYVRRAGRTSRGTNAGGNVSILVLGRQVKVARQIVARNLRQLPIHRLPELPD